MKPCQLCGARCWGLVTEPASAINLNTLWGKEISDFRRCSSCGSFASVRMIDGEPDFDQTMHQVSAMVSAAMRPDTRTERITRVILSKDGMTQSAPKVVAFARAIEAELDAPSADGAQAAGVDWAVLRFADRAAFELWMLEGLKDTPCPPSAEKTVASEFAAWLESRHVTG